MADLKEMMTEKARNKEVAKEKKFAKTMATITCLFFVTYFPIFLLKSVIKKYLIKVDHLFILFII